MSVAIHLIGIPLVLLFGLILGGVLGFIFGLRAGTKCNKNQKHTE
jgi:hypothetical protein